MHLLIYVARRWRADEAVAKKDVSGAEGLTLENQLHTSNRPRISVIENDTHAVSERKQPTTKAAALIVFPSVSLRIGYFSFPFSLGCPWQLFQWVFESAGPRIWGNFLRVPG